MALRDSALRYGTITRFLHWTMALLFAWQFGGMLLKQVVGRTPLMGFWVGTHGSVGTLLLIVMLLRGAWALAQLRKRPAYHADILGRLAVAGHIGLYALMFIVPLLALLRMVGGNKGVRLFGVQLQAPGGEPVAWMTAPGNLLHGNLAWLLLALIAGHVFMVIVHRFWFRDDVLSRMVGARRV